MGRLRHQAFHGATYFVTTKCWQGVQVFQVHEVAEILISKILEYRNKGSYSLRESVVMPNHVHLLITPGPSTSLEGAIQFVKGGSSREIHRLKGTNSEIWQLGFHESRVRDAADYKNKRDYIHFNPVVARLADKPQDWPFGSASGKYDLDPIPQRLKPVCSPLEVGPEGPTPNTFAAKGAWAVNSPCTRVSQVPPLRPSGTAFGGRSFSSDTAVRSKWASAPEETSYSSLCRLERNP